MHWLHAIATPAPVASPGSLWDWVTASTSVTDLLSASGLVAFVALFTTNRILTIGQHKTRVADLEKYYEGRLKEKDDRYVELKESRNYWREAHNDQRARAEKAEDGVREFADEYAKLSNHLLGSIEQAAGGPS
jgi:hypothetical protein